MSYLMWDCPFVCCWQKYVDKLWTGVWKRQRKDFIGADRKIHYVWQSCMTYVRLLYKHVLKESFKNWISIPSVANCIHCDLLHNNVGYRLVCPSYSITEIIRLKVFAVSTEPVKSLRTESPEWGFWIGNRGLPIFIRSRPAKYNKPSLWIFVIFYSCSGLDKSASALAVMWSLCKWDRGSVAPIHCNLHIIW